MLKISNLSKTFSPGTPDEKSAIDNLSLTVNDGDFITIIGSNGAGKSTLFNLICGSLLPDKGSIILDGEDISYVKEYIRSKYIGRIYQDPLKGSAPGLTIEENLCLACGKGGWLSISSREEKAFLRDQIARLNMGLENRMHSKVGLLSGGQRQAVTLMMATICPPKLLLLDEHTAALDPSSAEKVISITKDIVERNRLSCLMVTHNMQSALSLGNRTVMMDNGRIIYDVSGEERENLTVEDLLSKFREASGQRFDNDRIMLGN